MFDQPPDQLELAKLGLTCLFSKFRASVVSLAPRVWQGRSFGDDSGTVAWRDDVFIRNCLESFELSNWLPTP